MPHCASLGPALPPALRVDPGADSQATPLPTHGRSTGVSTRRPSVCSHTAKHWPCGFPFWFKCHRFPCGKKRQCSQTWEDSPQPLITGSDTLSVTSSTLRAPGPRGAAPPRGTGSARSTHTPHVPRPTLGHGRWKRPFCAAPARHRTIPPVQHTHHMHHTPLHIAHA